MIYSFFLKGGFVLKPERSGIGKIEQFQKINEANDLEYHNILLPYLKQPL